MKPTIVRVSPKIGRKFNFSRSNFDYCPLANNEFLIPTGWWNTKLKRRCLQLTNINNSCLIRILIFFILSCLIRNCHQCLTLIRLKWLYHFKYWNCYEKTVLQKNVAKDSDGQNLWQNSLVWSIIMNAQFDLSWKRSK